jgi:4-amino-4-deoxy-L-arabinose transferase-like glycosyltransferase
VSETHAPHRAPTLPGLPAARRRFAVPLPLVVLLVLAFVQGLAWSAMTLPFHGADEPAHMAYVQHLAETGHGPNELRGTGSISTEFARAEYELNLRPIFAHAGGRPTWSEVPSVSKQLEDVPDAQRKDGSGPNAIAQNPPLYYAYESLAYLASPDQSLFGRLFSLRAANLLLYVLTIALAWLAAAELSPRTWVRFLTAAVVALQPKLASLAGNVNPDTLLVTLSAAFLLAGLRLLRLGPSIGRVALVALCAGLGALTHGRGLFLVAPAVIVVAVALLRARPPRRVTLGAIGAGGAILLAGLAGAFEWTRSSAGGAGAFGGEVGRAAKLSFDPLQFFEYVWQFYLPRLPGMAPKLGPSYGFRQVYVDTFFGGYANLEVGFAGRTSSGLHALLLAGLIVLAVMAVVHRRELWARWPVVLLAVSTVGSLLALLHISSYRHMQVGGDPLITGRYLLPLLPVAGLAVAWLVARLPARLRAPAAAIVLAGLVLLDIKGFLVNAERFYS